MGFFNPNINSFQITKEYSFNISNRKLDFDLKTEDNIASKNFISIAQKYNAAIRTIPIEFIIAGDKTTKKDYFFVLWGIGFLPLILKNQNIKSQKI